MSKIGRRMLWIGAWALVASACGATPGAQSPDANTNAQPEMIQLVESWPLETTLDHEDIPDAKDVWIEMIRGAKEKIELSEFYGFTQPGSALELVLTELEARASDGVKVRCLFDAKFYKHNKDVPDRLAAHPNIDVRIFDVSSSMGGVLHIKMFVVDGRDAYLGSQNLDWRSLEHIQELGVRLQHPTLVEAMSDLFMLDWAIAGGKFSQADLDEARNSASYHLPLETTYKGEAVRVNFGASPRDWLMDRLTWDLAGLLDRIRKAKTRLRVQLLNYSTINYDGSSFMELEEALLGAADRGVEVQMMVADWSKKEKYIKQLQSLQRHPKVTIKLVTIPEWSGGFIPFARVIHSKYMTIDGVQGWLGTSNWSGDYFFSSRNAGIFVEGGRFVQDLDRIFEGLWGSEYAEIVDPEGTYAAPRVKE